MEEGKPAWEWLQELFGKLPPQNKVKQVLPDDATEETLHIYARAYIMMLLSTQLFGDKSGNRVHIRWLPFVARLDDMGSYSWGLAALAWLYRCMCWVPNRNVISLAAPCSYCSHRFSDNFLASGRRDSTYIPSHWLLGIHICTFYLLTLYNIVFVQEGHLLADIQPQGRESRLVSPSPYASLDVMAVVHPEILTEEHNRLWRACTCLIYFAVIEVLPQLGGVQHELEPASNINWLHANDGRGGDRWFPSYYQIWHLSWQNRIDAVLSIPRVPDPGPSADFLRWRYRVAHKFLSSDSLIANPRLRRSVRMLFREGRHRGAPKYGEYAAVPPADV
ncbi:hypothetical protein Ahy_A03g014543 [Arachis hypogaea]|uniref:Aminotransferase-like plant mobile domain-containing protein n=1 Tax=Arachis hypogaea TaxID=3818 RepID=A0A445DY94_ARAHY|nr:hypothetical protein Ahy_A03g014543 [Arachis hypogaea]